MVYGTVSTMNMTFPSLTEEEKEQYLRDGFLAKEGVLSPEQIEAVKAAFANLVATFGPDRERAELIQPSESRITSGALIQRRDSPFFFQLEKGQEPALDDLAALELQVRKFMWFEKEAPIFEELLDDDGPIASIVHDLIEDDPLFYQSMALIKPPHIGATKPWHQDNAYFSVSPLESICGVWIAIDEATVENGCMHMLKGEHRNGGFYHEHKQDCEIDPNRLDLSKLKAVPLEPGGALFFTGMTPHETPPNRSSQRRCALQFHFRGSRSEILAGPDYDQLFVDPEGLPASCAAARREGV